MRVFLSWSGEKSRAVSLALREWFPLVINSIKPFVSSKDIYAGSRWQAEIARELESTNFGIVCVTTDNQTSSWLNFEAGALAKAVDSSRVVPLAIDLKPSDIKLPLGQFQGQPASEAGMLDVLTSINAACPSPLPDALLAKAARQWWPELGSALEAIEASATDSTPSQPPRTERELLEEVVDAVRSLARGIDSRTLAEAASAETGGASEELIRTMLDRLTRAADSRQLREAAALELDEAPDDLYRTFLRRAVERLRGDEEGPDDQAS